MASSLRKEVVIWKSIKGVRAVSVHAIKESRIPVILHNNEYEDWLLGLNNDVRQKKANKIKMYNLGEKLCQITNKRVPISIFGNSLRIL